MNINSLIALLIPHYNDPEGLIESINSVREDIPVDIIVVDDGSDIKINENLLRDKKNLEIIYLEKNAGIETALNTGLKRILEAGHYKYIARLDAGDLNVENRLTKQFHYMESHPDVFLIGSWIRCVDENNNYIYTYNYPVDYKEIKTKMYLNSMFSHPSIMFKAETLQTVGFYPLGYKYAEDYAYFFNIIKKHKAENIPESLIIYKVSDKSVSISKRKQQVKSRMKVILHNWSWGIYPAYGLLRNMALYIIPVKILIEIKKIVKKS